MKEIKYIGWVIVSCLYVMITLPFAALIEFIFDYDPFYRSYTWIIDKEAEFEEERG